MKPLSRQLETLLDVHVDTPSDWLTVPMDYAKESTSGTKLMVPPELPLGADQETAVARVLRNKLGIDAMEATWYRMGAEPYVVCKPEPQAPLSCSMADVAEHIRNAKETAPVVGLTRNSTVVTLNLDDDSPHVLISAGSGGGKSVLAKALIAQFLRNGAKVVIFDRKRISHKWAKDLPGVRYFRDAPEIHHELLELAAEGDRRNRLTDHQDVPDVGQRIVVVFEEMNATMNKLKAYWEDVREKDDVKRSPALESLGDLVNMGRQVSMNVVAIGQRIETRTLGGGDIRESFGIRCLARYTMQTWKMLCAEIWPMPRKSRVRGRWQIVFGGESVSTQVVFMTDSEAQSLAVERVDQADKAGTPDLGTDGLATLREIFGDGYDRLRKASARSDVFPEPAVRSTNGGAHLYERVAVDRWVGKYDTPKNKMEAEVA